MVTEKSPGRGKVSEVFFTSAVIRFELYDGAVSTGNAPSKSYDKRFGSFVVVPTSCTEPAVMVFPGLTVT